MSNIQKSKKGKIIFQGEEMPDDFWNYRVNPILGYYECLNKNDVKRAE